MRLVFAVLLEKRDDYSVKGHLNTCVHHGKKFA
jgi:hypothetical protein